MEKQTFKVGDLIYNAGSEQYRRIVDQGVVGNVVFASFSWEKGEKECTTISNFAVPSLNLEKNGWKVVPESHMEEPTVVVGGKKYKKSDIDALTPVEE
jgi:hypothetical protein